jgi:hypothetical protein
MTEIGRVSGSLLLLDADILYPIRVCDFILTASSQRLLARPVVSDAILLEAQRNVSSDRPDLDSARVERRFNNVRVSVDGHGQPIDPFIDAAFVNPKDQHVLGAALQHRVDFVVSNDARLRREITTWLGVHGDDVRLTAALSANDHAERLLDEGPDTVAEIVKAMASRFRNPPRTFAETLNSLCKPMPALARLRNLNE